MGTDTKAALQVLVARRRAVTQKGEWGGGVVTQSLGIHPQSSPDVLIRSPRMSEYVQGCASVYKVSLRVMHSARRASSSSSSSLANGFTADNALQVPSLLALLVQKYKYVADAPPPFSSLQTASLPTTLCRFTRFTGTVYLLYWYKY